MVRFVIIAVVTAVLCTLAIELRRLDKRTKKLAASMEDFLNNGGEPTPFSLKEDSLALVENAAAELENRVTVLEERLRQENERTGSLTADISHQLKTPLTSLRLFCEMDESVHMPEQLDQIERMEKLIGNLLRLEKLCADGYEFHFTEQPVRPLVEAVWSALRPLWPEKELTVEGDGVIRCDGKWLSEAFENLLKNACEHTLPHGRIRVRLEQSEHMFYCVVEDDGGGVAEKDLPHLFERFYRAEGQEQSGFGLGLAIVREIIFRHHGHISAANTDAGLWIEFAVPILQLTKT